MQKAVGGPRAGFGVVSASAASPCPCCLQICLGRATGSTHHLPSLEHPCPWGISPGGHVIPPHSGKKGAALEPTGKVKPQHAELLPAARRFWPGAHRH